MVALHIWSLAHGIASLFGRGDAARRALPMTPEELLEAACWFICAGSGSRQQAWAGADLQGRRRGPSDKSENSDVKGS